MPALKREAVISACDLPRERIDVPEWGTDAYVFVRGLTADERDSWDVFCIEQRQRWKSEIGFPGMRASLVVRAVVDDEGNRIFLDTDLESIGAKSIGVVDRLYDKASQLSGMTGEAKAELKND